MSHSHLWTGLVTSVPSWNANFDPPSFLLVQQLIYALGNVLADAVTLMFYTTTVATLQLVCQRGSSPFRGLVANRRVNTGVEYGQRNDVSVGLVMSAITYKWTSAQNNNQTWIVLLGPSGALPPQWPCMHYSYVYPLHTTAAENVSLSSNTHHVNCLH